VHAIVPSSYESCIAPTVRIFQVERNPAGT
jgi:hypothetical protein